MTANKMNDFTNRYGGSDQRNCSLPDRAFFHEQLLRIDSSGTTKGTRELAIIMHYKAREILGKDLSVFWDSENDEITFEGNGGFITVGKFDATNATAQTPPDSGTKNHG